MISALRHFRVAAERISDRMQLKMVLRKPQLLIRMTRVLMTHALTNKTVIWDFAMSVTPECNLSCEHCFDRAFSLNAERDGTKRKLTTQELVAVVREQLALGVVSFSFQGGEVFYRKDLEQIIKACEPHRSYVTIITNGILFTDETAAKLKRWGVDNIMVSIDSGIAEEHDAFRKHEGTLKAATEAIDRARRLGFACTIATTVTHQSLRSDGFRKIYEFAKERKILQFIFIAIPVGNWNSRDDLVLDEADSAYLDQLNRESGGTLRRDLHPHLFREGCPAVKESVYMSPYGDILPCPFLHTSLGNVREHTSADIIGRAMEEVEEFRVHTPTCLIAEDKDFIARFGSKTFDAEDGPVDGEALYEFKRRLPRRAVPLGEEPQGS